LEIEVSEKGRNTGAKRTLSSDEILDVDWELADDSALEGMRAYKQGAYARAADSLSGVAGTKEALDRMRPVARAYLVYIYAESLLRSGKAAQAYPVFQSLTETYKTSRYAPMALNNMAMAAVQAKAFDKLPPLLAQLREAGGDQKLRADYLEAEALLAQGKAKDALAKFSSASIGNSSVKALALTGQAKAAAALNDFSKAREAAQSVLNASPTTDLAAEAHAILGDAIMADIETKKPTGGALQDALLDAALEYLRVQNQYPARADTEGRALLKAGECFQKLSTLPHAFGNRRPRTRAVPL